MRCVCRDAKLRVYARAMNKAFKNIEREQSNQTRNANRTTVLNFESQERLARAAMWVMKVIVWIER